MGLLLLAVSALFKAYVRASDESDSEALIGSGAGARFAARIGQYLGLLGASFVILLPQQGTARSMLLLATLFASYLVLLLLGRALATLAPAALLAFMRLPLALWSVLTLPLVVVARSTDIWLQKRKRPKTPPSVEEALEGWLATSGLEEDERSLFHNTARFCRRSVGELMVPRPDVVWLSTDDSAERSLRLVRESGHSRFPVCNESPDQVIGYLHVRDFGLMSRFPNPAQLRSLARPVTFVPEMADAMSLLRRFQRERSHLAVVVDEFGGTAGIVTLEDLLEALVGEIQDEFDDDEVEVTQLHNGDVLLDGAVRLEDLERGYGISFGDVEEETVGGFIFGRLAREVTAGDEVVVGEARLRVEGVEGLRVTRVRLISTSHAQAAV